MIVLAKFQTNNSWILFCSSSGCHFPLSNPFFFLLFLGLSCLQLVNSRVVDGIAFSAVRLHHVVATICGYSDMCGHRGKSMPQQRSQIWGLMRSAKTYTADFGSDFAFRSFIGTFLWRRRDDWGSVHLIYAWYWHYILVSGIGCWPSWKYRASQCVLCYTG